MNTIEELIIHLKNKKKLGLFLGAGVSIGSGIPGGFGVIQILKEKYPNRFKKDKNYGYAEAFRAALPGMKNRKERRRFFENLCAGKSPDRAHYLVAHLFNHGIFSVVITTNFDHLLEAALSNYCRLNPRIYLYDMHIEPCEYADEYPKIIKLHGDFLFDDLANLEREMKNRLNENMKHKIQDYLCERGLVVVGYGGDDTSIMEFLKQTSKSKLGLVNGLWWVTYKESEQEIMKKNEKLADLAENLRYHNKPFKIIESEGAASFFENLYESLGLSMPSIAPFGIPPVKKYTIFKYLPKFGKARQYLLGDRCPKFNRRLERTVEQLREALSTPAIIWLQGPSLSGKTTILKRLAEVVQHTRIFYFNHRFAHVLVDFDLSNDQVSFANANGIITEGLWREETVRKLLEKGKILIFDDPFSDILPMHEEYTASIINIIASQIVYAKGCVVIVSTIDPPECILMDIHHTIKNYTGNGDLTLSIGGNIVTRSSPNIKTHLRRKIDILNGFKYYLNRGFTSFWPEKLTIKPENIGVRIQRIKMDSVKFTAKRIKRYYEKYSDVDRKVLKFMSLMQYADTAEVISHIVDESVSIVREKLIDFVNNGLVAVINQKYLLNKDVERIIYSIDMPAVQMKKNIARKYEKLAQDSPYFLNQVHYLLQAENHYWYSGCHEEGAKIFVNLGNLLIGLGASSFVFETIIDYFGNNQDTKQIASTLPQKLQFNLLLLLYKSFLHIIPRDETLFPGLIRLVNESALSFTEEYKRILFGYLSQVDNDHRSAVEHFKEANEILSKHQPSQILGDVQLELSNLFSEMAEKDNDPHFLHDAYSWAQKAVSTFSEFKDQRGVAKVLDNISTIQFQMGKYEEALEISEQQREIFASEEALTHDKAVAYGNLAHCYLMDGDIAKASGYFFESNLNFACIGDWQGCLRNFLHLFNFGLHSTRSKRESYLPSLSTLYHIIINSLRGKIANSPDVPYLAMKTISSWFNYSLEKRRLRSVFLALDHLLEFTHFLHEEIALRCCLNLVARAFRIFKKKSNNLNTQIPQIARANVSLYRYIVCFCEWLNSDAIDLDKYLEKYRINSEIGKIMKEVWEENRNKDSPKNHI